MEVHMQERRHFYWAASYERPSDSDGPLDAPFLGAIVVRETVTLGRGAQSSSDTILWECGVVDEDLARTPASMLCDEPDHSDAAAAPTGAAAAAAESSSKKRGSEAAAATAASSDATDAAAAADGAAAAPTADTANKRSKPAHAATAAASDSASRL